MFFHLCEGRKPEEYLISLTVADPQNKLKLIKLLQETVKIIGFYM